MKKKFQNVNRVHRTGNETNMTKDIRNELALYYHVKVLNSFLWKCVETKMSFD